jgi:hypothetical protein
MSLNKKSQETINKTLTKAQESVEVIKKLEPLWNLEIKHNKISKGELLDEFYKLLPKHIKDIINYCFDKKGIEKFAQYVADVDYTLYSGSFIIIKKTKNKKRKTGKNKSMRKTHGGDDNMEIVEVERQEKRVFFDTKLCGALISILLGILFVYLALKDLSDLSESFNMNISVYDVVTNFKSTIESLPVKLVNSINKEVINDIQYNVRRGCMSASDNTLTDMISAYINPSGTMTCMMEGTKTAIDNTLKTNARQMTNGIDRCYHIITYGFTLLTGGGLYIVKRLKGTKSKSMLLEDSRNRITRGGNKTQKNRT